jgi:hypothetical protein
MVLYNKIFDERKISRNGSWWPSGLRSKDGAVGSNPTEVVDIRLLCLLFIT